jgi:hypothetical protein
MRPNNGAISISDPRLPKRNGRHAAVYQIVKWDETGPCVTGTRFGSGAPAISDPRLFCKPRSGTMGVQRWDEPSTTVIGSSDVHDGAAAIADPRIPDDKESGVFVIIAEDGTWHRPLTTLELASLQGLPMTLANGEPLRLAGNSDARGENELATWYRLLQDKRLLKQC